MSVKNYFLLFGVSLFAVALTACGPRTKKPAETAEAGESDKISIIYETDMGNDIDDALVLDMLYKYAADQDLIDILAILINKDNPYPARFIDIMNKWYGYQGIPVGMVAGGVDDTVPVNYPKVVTEMKAEDGSPLFTGYGQSENLPEAVQLYRKILSAQPDNSMVLVSTGFSTNIARLLDSPADEYSELTGKELVRKKVKLTSIMACNFTSPDAQEYNIMKDIPAAAKVFDQWPTPIVLSPFELGAAVEFPADIITGEMSEYGPDPLVEAYKAYRPMPYNNAVFDLTSVLYAIEGENNYFSLSNPGEVTVNPDGTQRFTEQEGGKVRVMYADDTQLNNIKSRIVNLIKERPQARGKQ